MYATIRRFAAKNPSSAKDLFTGLKQRIEDNFLPRLQEIPGFHCYYVVNANNRELVSVSIFETPDGAKESTRRSAEFVRADPAKDQLQDPEIIEGELLVGKEMPVGAH
jgi:hypothetical protein